MKATRRSDRAEPRTTTVAGHPHKVTGDLVSPPQEEQPAPPARMGGARRPRPGAAAPGTPCYGSRPQTRGEGGIFSAPSTTSSGAGGQVTTGQAYEFTESGAPTLEEPSARSHQRGRIPAGSSAERARPTTDEGTSPTPRRRRSVSHGQTRTERTTRAGAPEAGGWARRDGGHQRRAPREGQGEQEARARYAAPEDTRAPQNSEPTTRAARPTRDPGSTLG